MPALGVAQEKGTLLNWFKAEGQSVTKGEPLMEVETDKATVEIEAPASGILKNVTASAGDEIPVGNKIAVILAPGEVATPAALRTLTPGSCPGQALALNPQPTIHRANRERNQIPLFPPLSKGDRRGISSPPKLHLLLVRAYSRLQQPSESLKSEASISNPSKEAGLRQPSLPKMLYGLPAHKPHLRQDHRKSRKQSSLLKCAASSASG